MFSSSPPRPSEPPRNGSYTSLPGTLTSALSWTLHRLTAPAPADPTASIPRRASPFTPPPLPPLSLNTSTTAAPFTPQLTTSLAEEIRLLLPPRLQLHDTWTLAYSLETHGVSLATLYERGRARGSHGSPCVLVVRDSLGGMFGAFANEAFRPSGGRYYGTGECFLWKATQLGGGDGAVRFKAFPYSGVNDYMMLCDAHSLSVGGGDDGRYGLWLDDTLAKGVSARCETFGNEPLSESGGGKFEILDVELWMVGPVGS